MFHLSVCLHSNCCRSFILLLGSRGESSTDLGKQPRRPSFGAEYENFHCSRTFIICDVLSRQGGSEATVLFRCRTPSSHPIYCGGSWTPCSVRGRPQGLDLALTQLVDSQGQRYGARWPAALIRKEFSFVASYKSAGKRPLKTKNCFGSRLRLADERKGA